MSILYSDNRKKDYIIAEKCVLNSMNIDNVDSLIIDSITQNMISHKNFMKVTGKGYIVLDFGKEYFGGIRILTNNLKNDNNEESNFRIRFGESFSECMAELGEKNATNDHSTRDLKVYMSSNSDMEWGVTGYRFVRIDFLCDYEYRINNIYGVFVHSEYPLAKFESDNVLLNEIWKTATRTLFLNIQNNCIWDGIKRDQHVWVGDLYPEVLSALYLYGDCKYISNSLDYTIENYPMPCWYNEIPTYNMWFVIVTELYFRMTLKKNEKYAEVVYQILLLFDKCIDENGQIDYSKSNLDYWEEFFDWQSFNTKYRNYGCYCLIYYGLKKVKESNFFNKDTIELAEKIIKKINKINVEETDYKPIEAFKILINKGDIEKSLNCICAGGAEGYSTFLIYFILKALSEKGKTKEAFNSMLEYYGGMIKMGATTFWESFDIKWVKNACGIDKLPEGNLKDIHGDYGEECYKGFRHSLCHGWSSGVIPFIIENIIGFSFIDEEHKFVQFKPNLCGLKKLKCTFMTDKGTIYVKYKFENNKLKIKVKLPDGIEMVQGENV